MTIDQTFVDVIKAGNFVVLDVETTGKEHYDVICEIAIIDSEGNTLLHTKVNPLRPIAPDAIRIHGITDDDVKDAPTWKSVSIDVAYHLEGKDVIVWNEKHERMLFHRSDESVGLSHFEWKNVGRWHDAMTFYAEVWGEPNEKYPNAKWQSLGNAIKQQNLPEGLFHSALGDTMMTRALCYFVANFPEKVKVWQKPMPDTTPDGLIYLATYLELSGAEDFAYVAQQLTIGYEIAGIVPAHADPTTGTAHYPVVFLTKKL